MKSQLSHHHEYVRGKLGLVVKRVNVLPKRGNFLRGKMCRKAMEGIVSVSRPEIMSVSIRAFGPVSNKWLQI